MNCIEVAASFTDPAGEKEAQDDVVEAETQEENSQLLGITFLNKHCFVPDLAATPSAEGTGDDEHLLRRSFELKL